MFMSAPDGGRIYRFKDTGSDFPIMGEMELVYTDPDLVFDPNLPIRAVGRYETEDIQKVYFTDTENFFYHLNTIHDPVFNNLTGLYVLFITLLETSRPMTSSIILIVSPSSITSRFA